MLGSDYFMVGLRTAPRLRSRGREISFQRISGPETRPQCCVKGTVCCAGIGKQEDDVVGKRVELC